MIYITGFLRFENMISNDLFGSVNRSNLLYQIVPFLTGARNLISASVEK